MNSSERAAIQEHLVQAERHVTEGEQRVARQRGLIEAMRQTDHDTTRASALLEQLEETLALEIAHRDLLRTELGQAN